MLRTAESCGRAFPPVCLSVANKTRPIKIHRVDATKCSLHKCPSRIHARKGARAYTKRPTTAPWVNTHTYKLAASWIFSCCCFLSGATATYWNASARQICLVICTHSHVNSRKNPLHTNTSASAQLHEVGSGRLHRKKAVIFVRETTITIAGWNY